MARWLQLSLVSFFAISQLAIASDEVRILKWTVGGHGCSKRDVQLIENGNIFALLFDDLGPKLESGVRSDGFAQSKFCIAFFLLEVPKGKCIQGIDQLVRGGLLKSANTNGSLHFLSWINGSLVMRRAITWARGQEITPEDEASQFEISQSLNTHSCLRYQTYLMQLNFNARRFSWNNFFMGNVDSLDGSFQIRAR